MVRVHELPDGSSVVVCCLLTVPAVFEKVGVVVLSLGVVGHVSHSRPAANNNKLVSAVLDIKIQRWLNYSFQF
jgi:hypothetical protein